MRRTVLFILSILFIEALSVISPCPGSLARAETARAPGTLFYQANIYYKEGKYDAAIKSYQSLLDKGWESGNLYYNLGNSYFKEGKLGFAVLNYEKARCLMPNDNDLKSNYDYVLQELNLQPRLFGGWPEKAVYTLFKGFTIDGLTILLSFIYIILIAYLILSLFLGSLKRFLWPVSCLCIAIFALSAYALAKKIDYSDKSATVISAETDARFEPLENATVFFKLTQGMRVEIEEQLEGWLKVRRFDNKSGWVKKDSLGR